MKWQHRKECTETECFCADPEQSDPICDCGAPGWACQCDRDEDRRDIDRETAQRLGLEWEKL